MKCLIVEDDILSAELLKMNLQDYGTCYTVTNGLLTVETIRSSIEQDDPYDIIFLDIMMPGMNGHETLKTIRRIEEEYGVEKSSRVKIVMVTCMGDAGNIMSSFQEGCDGYIVKPVQEGNLIKEMEKLGFSRCSL